ncbi:MAG: PKD domain-containing protein [Bacilli bacterium]
MGRYTVYLILLGICLVGVLAVQPVAAEDGSDSGILEAIVNFFTWWLPEDAGGTSDPVTILSDEPEIPGTNITVTPTPTPTVEPGENESVADPTPRTLGTVYAVEYRTSPPYGSAPFLVRFTAVNESDVEYTHWQFGDGFSSTERDHWHTYTGAGSYIATLTVGNSTWNQTAEIAITVEPPGVVPLPEEEMML